MMRCAERTAVRQFSARKLTRNRGDHRNVQQFARRKTRQNGWQSLGKHGFARSRWPYKQQIMVTSGGDFKRPLGGLLPLYVGKIEFRFTGNPHGWFRPGQNLRTAKMVGKSDQTTRCQNINVSARPGRLRPAGIW